MKKEMEKLRVGSTYFVKRTRDAASTLFEAGGTASGTYKKTARGVTFYDLKGEKFAFLVAKPVAGLFPLVDCWFVSCRTQKDGKTVYFSGPASADRAPLGIDGMSFLAERHEAERVWNTVIANDNKKKGLQ